MSSTANRRLNFEGNTEDEAGGSFYVEDARGRRIAGPFGAASYAMTVRDRLRGEWEAPRVEYDP